MRDEIKEEVERQLAERDAARAQRFHGRWAVVCALVLALIGGPIAWAQQGQNAGGSHQQSDLFRRFFTWDSNNSVFNTGGSAGIYGWASSASPRVILDTTIGAQLDFAGVQLFCNGTRCGSNAEIRSTVASGSNAFGVATNGARWDFGTGASDYATSDGTTVTFASNVAVVDLAVSGGDIFSNLTSQSFFYDSAADDTTVTTTQPAHVLTSAVNYTAGDAIAGFGHNGDTAGASFKVTTYGAQDSQRNGTAGSGTGFTTVATGQMTTKTHVITITNAALNAAATSDETFWTLAAKSRVLRVIADVTTTFSGGGITDMDVTCGNSAGGNQYLLTFDVDTAIGTYGDVVAEIGASLLSATYADVSWAAGPVVQCRFTCVGANCNAATQGSMTLYIEHMIYPP